MIRTLLLYAVISVTVVLALAACGSPSPSPVTTPAVTPASIPASTPAAATPAPAPYAGAHPNYGADYRRPATEAPPVPTSTPTPTPPPTPAGTPTTIPSCHIHTLPNSNCHTRCDCGYNKYAYPHTCSDSYACARHSRTAAGFRGKGQRSNAAVS